MASDRNLELALRIRAELNQARSDVHGFQVELRATATAADKADKGARNAARGINEVERNSKSASTVLQRISRLLAAAFAVHEITSFTKSLVEANVRAQRIQYTLEQVFGSDASKQFEFLHQEADRLGLSLADVAEGYAQLAASAQGTGISTRALQKVFVGMNEAATVLHTSTQDVAGVFVQLSQGISLGKLQMQDIRAIAQHLPGTMTVLQEAAKRLGTTLSDSLAHGGLDAKKMLEAIGDVLHERFGQKALEASHSLNAELNRLKTTLFLTKTQGTGFADSFAGAVRQLNQALSDPSVQEGLRQLIRGLGDLVSYTLRAVSAIAGLSGEIADAFRSVEGKSYNAVLGEYSAVGDRIASLKKRLKELDKEGSKGGGLLSRLALSQAGGQAVVPSQVQIDSTKTTKQLKDEIAALTKEQEALGKRAEAMRKAANKPPVKLPKVDLPKIDPGEDKKAEQAAKREAQAQQQLANIISSLGKDALGPVTAEWDKYTKAVRAADLAGAKAIQNGANVGQVQAQVAKAVELAGQARDKAIADLHSGLEAKLARATGDEAKAQRIAIEQQYGLLLQDLERQGDKAGVTLVKKLINVQEAQGQMQDLQQQVDRALADQSRQEQNIQAEQSAGLITEYQARKEILALHQRTVGVLDQLLPKLREVAAATGNPKAIEGVKNLEAEIERLKLKANNLKIALDSGITDGLEQGMEGLFTQTTTLAGAFKDLAQSVERSLAQVAARALAEKAISGLNSLFGGDKPTKDVSAGATKLSAASVILGGASGLLGVNADKLQSAATTLLAANSVGAVAGFASGGWTGNAGVTEIAGVVHGKEYVQPAYRMAEPGALDFMRAFHVMGMDALSAWAPGYAQGGYVDPLRSAQPPRIPAPPSSNLPRVGAGTSRGQHASLNARIVNVVDPNLVAGYLRGQGGKDDVINIISENRSTVRQLLN